MTDLPVAKINLKLSDALLVVDIKNDFLPGGALGVGGVPSTYRFLIKFMPGLLDSRFY